MLSSIESTLDLANPASLLDVLVPSSKLCSLQSTTLLLLRLFTPFIFNTVSCFLWCCPLFSVSTSAYYDWSLLYSSLFCSTTNFLAFFNAMFLYFLHDIHISHAVWASISPTFIKITLRVLCDCMYFLDYIF